MLCTQIERLAKHERPGPDEPTDLELEARLQRNEARRAYRDAVRIEDYEYKRRVAQKVQAHAGAVTRPHKPPMHIDDCMFNGSYAPGPNGLDAASSVDTDGMLY